MQAIVDAHAARALGELCVVRHVRQQWDRGARRDVTDAYRGHHRSHTRHCWSRPEPVCRSSAPVLTPDSSAQSLAFLLPLAIPLFMDVSAVDRDWIAGRKRVFQRLVQFAIEGIRFSLITLRW